MAIKEITEAINKYDDFVITSHVNAEGDAIGSELAILYLIKQLGKDAIIVHGDEVPQRYLFLPGADKIIVVGGEGMRDYDQTIIVDCPTIERCGKLESFVRGAKIKINIDHHVSNENFGDYNWVNPHASSCGEMVFQLFKEMNLNINEDIATMLYVAILTDTGSFRYDSTTAETHCIAGELIKIGVHPAKIAQRVYETKTLGDISLLSKALSTLTVTANGKISYMYVTKDMMEQTRTKPDRTDGFINFARAIEGSEISIFFREDTEQPNRVHVSFRSRGMVNVNVLASKFGGGGHPKASGCFAKGDLRSTMKKVIRTAEEFLL